MNNKIDGSLHVRLRPINHFELFGEDGTSLGMFRVTDQWEGFAKFETLVPSPGDTPDTLIVRLPVERDMRTRIETSSLPTAGEVRVEVLKATPLLISLVHDAQEIPEAVPEPPRPPLKFVESTGKFSARHARS